MRTVFSKIFEKAGYSNPFSDFSGLDLMFAEAHARGFAHLSALARGNSGLKIARRTSKKYKIWKKSGVPVWGCFFGDIWVKNHQKPHFLEFSKNLFIFRE